MMTQSQLTWSEFLSRLETGLMEFARQIESSPPDKARVVYDPQRCRAGVNEILIGVGSWVTCDSSGQQQPQVHKGVCLNDKGAKIKDHSIRAPRSITEFVTLADDDYCTEWRYAVGGDSDLVGFFQRFTLIVEDASPDSCLGFIAFLARLNGVPASEIPSAWVEYASRWEGGDVRTTGQPDDSWGTLHSVLSHSQFSHGIAASDAMEDRKAEHTNLGLGLAWLECLRFDLGALRSNAPPHELSLANPWPELLRARAFLSFEHQQYIQAMQHGIALQLLLPMPRTEGRRKLVDAFLEEEHLPLGVKKTFLRQDKKHTYLGDGFCLWGVFRPALAGSGNDMAISVDPAIGVHLEELWRELEHMEDVRWGSERPNDNPRQPIHAYPGGHRPDGSPSPNEPWWDDRGHYTLLAAPKRLVHKPGQPLGSKLTWEDVSEAVWRLYNPMGRLTVLDDSSKEMCQPHSSSCIRGHNEQGGSGKLLRIGHWKAESEGPLSLILCPTVQRYLAASAARKPGDLEPIKLRDLPPIGSFDFLDLAGGYAAIHKDGVYLLDDWRSEPLEAQELVREFDLAARRVAFLRQEKARAEDLITKIGSSLGRLSGRDPNCADLLCGIIEQKLRTRQELAATLPAASSAGALQFREALEARWGVGTKLDDLYDSLHEIEATMRDRNDMATSRMIKIITLYGFPAILLATFFQFTLRNSDSTIPIPVGPRVVNLPGIALNYTGLALFIAFVVLGVFVLRFWTNRSRSSVEKRKQD